MRIDDFLYRFVDQPGGWLGATEKVDMPILINLRLDPFERTGMSNGVGIVHVHELVRHPVLAVRVRSAAGGEAAETAIEFPPMQHGASFNLDAVKVQIQKAMRSHAAA